MGSSTIVKETQLLLGHLLQRTRRRFQVGSFEREAFSRAHAHGGEKLELLAAAARHSARLVSSTSAECSIEIVDLRYRDGDTLQLARLDVSGSLHKFLFLVPPVGR